MGTGYAYATKGTTTDVDLRISSCDVDYLGTTDPTMEIDMDIRNEAGSKVDTLLGETVSITAFLDNSQIQLKLVGAGSWETQLDFTVVNYNTTFYGFDCTDIEFDVDVGDLGKMVRIMGTWGDGNPWKRGKLLPKVVVPPSADCTSCVADCTGAATITMVLSNMAVTGNCKNNGTYTLEAGAGCNWLGTVPLGSLGLDINCVTNVWKITNDNGGANQSTAYPTLFCSGDHPTGSGSWSGQACNGDFTIS